VTLARLKAYGRGRLHARIAIEGYPENLVSSSAAASATRVAGLRLDTLQFGVKADLAHASLESTGFSVEVLADKRRPEAYAALVKRPTLTTYLVADLTTGATTATVSSTAGWPSTGTVHIGTEAIAYSGTTATTFTGLTRGAHGSTAQAHYIANGEGLSYPRVTDRPESLEGRRVSVYLYGDGDDVAGAGTLRWRGVASSGVRVLAGKVSFSVDPITRLLDQEIGGDLSDPITIRGIYYPWNSPLVLILTNVTQNATVAVKLAGRFDDQAAFCAELTTRIAAAIAAKASWTWRSGSEIRAQVTDAATGWELVYIVGSGAGTVAVVAMNRDVESRRASQLLIDEPHGYDWRDEAGDIVGVPVAGRVYRIGFTSLVPRAMVGVPAPAQRSDLRDDYVSPSDAAAAPPRRIYLGGNIVPTTSMTLSFEDDERGEGIPLVVRASAADTTLRYVDVESMPFRALTGATRIRIGRHVASGSLADFRAALITDSPTLCNAGAMPLITSADISSFSIGAEASGLANDRRFVAYEGIRLRDIVEHELRAIGHYQRIDASGAIEWTPVRPALLSDVADWEVGPGDLLEWVSFERGQMGTLTEVIYRTGWDPAEDEWRGVPVKARDVAASSPNRISVPMSIERRSVAVYYDPSSSVPEVAPSEVARLAMAVFAAFGGAYDTLQLVLPLTFLDVLVGDVVRVTASDVPDALTGTLGISERVGRVVGVQIDLGTGRVVVEAMVQAEPYAGYAPGYLVAGQSNVSGNTWDITLTLAETTAEAIDAHLAIGDLVRVEEFDDDTPVEVTGTVASFPSATVVRVTFGSVWTPGSSEWVLRARDSTAYASADRVAKYAFVGETTKVVDFSDTDPQARVFS
jgi:hypothetical protein